MQFLGEIQQMVVAAREAQEKAARFGLMLLDRNADDLAMIAQLISMVRPVLDLVRKES